MGKVASERHLNAHDIRERFHISESTLHRWRKHEALAFPKPLKINGRMYFRESDIIAWECTKGRTEQPPEAALGLPVVSDVIQSYDAFVAALVRRRGKLALSSIELDALSGMQEGYTSKLENYGKHYGRGMGPETFPLWLGGLRLGIVLVDLPRRSRMTKERAAFAKAITVDHEASA